MSGEKDLSNLLKAIQPKLHAGEFVFCCVPNLTGIDPRMIVFYFAEEEGITLVLPKDRADQMGLHYLFVAAWITLAVHSSLEAVGLTAAFSTALTKGGISCNVVAGYYHDHIFVNTADAEKAMAILREMK